MLKKNSYKNLVSETINVTQPVCSVFHRFYSVRNMTATLKSLKF